jgi:fatty-acyl-CoA synthase
MPTIMPRGASADAVRAAELSRILAYHAATQPRRLAFTDADGQVDFKTLYRRVNRLANALLAAGIRKGDRVALRLTNSRRHFEALFACARLTAILVPLPADASTDDIDAIKRDCAPALAIESEQVYETLLAQAAETELIARASSDDPLLIMHTSGTTGRPKGAVLTHGNLLYTVFNQMIGWRLTARDRALVVAPFHHAGGLLALGLPCLHAGGSVHVAAATPGCILEIIEREEITVMFLPPRLWNRVADDFALNTAKVASVRLCASGGDPLPRHILDRLATAFTAEFTDAYGMTEASSCLTLLRADDFRRRRGFAGKALPYTRIRIVATDGNEAESNEIGEIVVAGPTIMQCYWRRPEDTDEVFRDGWFHTGDLGRIDSDGNLQVLGRSTDIIVADGAQRIFPSEIEMVLREHPAVEEAAVTGLSRAAVGDTVAAWVVLRHGTRSAAPELAAYCAEHLAEEKRPREIFFCESLPRNANGKIVKAKLLGSYGAG